ncbi:MAG: hypothetical protein GY938_17605 [Ketobacter sp.]|nr:hypothetical protein [Ketobacter sp.]
MKYQGCVISFLLALTLFGCGGGGGGGNDTAPANVDTPNPETPEELQTGMFTDAPVTGLRFTQGRREGYTESGRFTYDARSSDPVCFFVGEVRLGCVAGSAVVTPYHLSSPGQPAGLQSGYNISRLLISLDESIGPEITLPTQTRRARGYINFALSDGLFATDSVVNDLIERYAPEGSLSTRQDVDAHISDNADVQQSIQALTQTLESEISDITIRWNSTLAEAGVLAHIEARSGAQPQQTEHLYMEVSQYNTQLYLSNLTYIDSNGEYTQVRVGRNGQPTRVADRDQVQAYLNMLNTTLESWVATSSYQPEKSGYLIGGAGLQSRVETRYLSDDMAGEIVDIIGAMGSQGLSSTNLLRIASYAAAIVQSVECAGSSGPGCGSKLQDVLLLAQADSGYESRVVSWIPEAMSSDLCLPLAGVSVSESCGVAPNLRDFNVVMSNRLDDYSGVFVPYWTELADDANDFLAISMVDRIGEVTVVYGLSCRINPTSYRFNDDVYYFGFPASDATCEELTGDDAAYLFQCGTEQSVELSDCNDFGVDLPGDWPGFSRKRSLAFTVATKLIRSGYGGFAHYFDTNNEFERRYLDELSIRMINESIPNESVFTELGINVDESEFYSSGTVPYILGFANPAPLTSVATISNEGYFNGFLSFLKYRNNDNTEVSLYIAARMEY